MHSEGMNRIVREIQWLLQDKYGGPLRPPRLSEAGSETSKITQEAKKDIERLQRGEHVDYVIGWVDFLGCKIDLSQKPFIPRPETEYWVERAIDEMRRAHSAFSSRFIPLGGSPTRLGRKRSARVSLVHCLDIFAGSGCIGIAILKHVPCASVDFAEKGKKFCEQIKINAKLNSIDHKRYRVIQSDIFSRVRGKYDFIFANPPYVALARKSKVQRSVLKNEPHRAVFGGKDGLYYIRKVLKESKKYLAAKGVVYLEFDSYQKPMLAKLIVKEKVTHCEFLKDQFGKWRYARIIF